jgi:hypothetical protein
MGVVTQVRTANFEMNSIRCTVLHYWLWQCKRSVLNAALLKPLMIDPFCSIGSSLSAVFFVRYCMEVYTVLYSFVL